jgi:hypothetical protein
MTVKLVVIYPRPKDIEAFETVYNRDHFVEAIAISDGKVTATGGNEEIRHEWGALVFIKARPQRWLAL